LQNSSSASFENGYVEESKVKNAVQKMGLYEVTISAVVCQRGKEDSGWGWITAIIVIIVLLSIIASVKNKGVAIVIWLISAISLFATGHWAVALTVTILGLGAFKK
jgi:cell division protein FtsW (lipid II flippase)